MEVMVMGRRLCLLAGMICGELLGSYLADGKIWDRHTRSAIGGYVLAFLLFSLWRKYCPKSQVF